MNGVKIGVRYCSHKALMYSYAGWATNERH
jgi:hypothetical protein